MSLKSPAAYSGHVHHSSTAPELHGNSYVSGRTLAPDFPLTQPTLESQCLGNTWSFGILGSDPRFASCPDFVSVLNPAGSQLMFSTLIGGPAFVADNEFSTGVTGIAANSSGIYISGSDGNVYVAVPGIGNAAPLTASGLIAKISTSGSSPVATILPQNIDFGAVATGSTSPPRTATVKND